MNPYQIQKILKARKGIEDELAAMADTPRIAKAVARSRDGKGKGQHLRAASMSIRVFEELDRLLAKSVAVKKLPKPKYPGGRRV